MLVIVDYSRQLECNLVSYAIQSTHDKPIVQVHTLNNFSSITENTFLRGEDRTADSLKKKTDNSFRQKTHF